MNTAAELSVQNVDQSVRQRSRPIDGWGLILATVVVGCVLMVFAGAWVSLSIGEALHYSAGRGVAGSMALAHFDEAMFGVGSGAVLVVLVFVASLVAAIVIAVWARLRKWLAVGAVVVPLLVIAGFFVVRPFVLDAMGIYQG